MGVPSLRERLKSDDGLTLVECLWALIVFSIAAGGLAFSLQAASHTSGNNRLRVQAANLGARELEIDRNEFNATADGPLVLGATGSTTNPHNLIASAVAGSSLVIDGVPFQVQREVQWLPTGYGQSPCDGGAQVTYPTLKVTVAVTWANMGSTQPVTNSTLLTPAKNTVATTNGYIAAKIIGADGTGVENMPVVFAKSGSGSQTRLTESDGCAVFATNDYGNWTVTVNQPGYVTPDLVTSRTKAATVATGTLTQVPISYDRSATINTTQTTLGGYGLPTSLAPLSFYNSGLPAPGRTAVTAVSGVTTALGGLWPFTDGYSAWPGSCDQSDPATSGGTRDAGVPLVAGATVNQTVSLAPINLLVRQRNVTNTAWLTAPGVTVRATPVSATGCAVADTLTLGVTDSAGALQVSLPAGPYTITVNGRSPQSGYTWPVTAANLSKTVPTTVPTINLAF